MSARSPSGVFRWPGFRRRGERSSAAVGQALGVWTIWAAMTLMGLWLAGRYALTMPYGDEWTLLPTATGHRPVTLDWLWSQHNEHRLFLPKLIYVGIGAVSRWDFRAAAFCSVLALSGLSLLMVLAAAAARRRIRITDAVFPLALLHWGHYLNLLWGFQVTYVTSVVLVGVLLTLIARCGGRLSLWSAVTAAVCLVGLTLCGMEGLVYVPAMACWLVLAGIGRWRDGQPRARAAGGLTIGLAVLPMILLGLYFVGYSRSTPQAAWPGPAASMRTGLQFTANGLGPAAKEVWPISGILLLAGCAWGVWLAARAYRRRPQQRDRAAGFLCFLAAAVGLAVAIGVGRSGYGPESGFMPRYVTLAVPLLCCIYLLGEAYATPVVSGRLRRVFLMVMCVAAAVNARKGLPRAADLTAPVRALEADVRLGIPPRFLAVRHCRQRGFAASQAALTRLLQTLRQARLGPYRKLPVQPASAGLKIRRLAQLHSSQPPVERVRLSAGHSVSQRFRVGEPMELSRIDVDLGKRQRGCSPARLQWTLKEVTATGPGILLASGEIALRGLPPDDCATLRCAGVRVGPGRLFELGLRASSASSADAEVDIPLYRSMAAGVASAVRREAAVDGRASLRAFLYLDRAGIARLARRRADGL